MQVKYPANAHELHRHWQQSQYPTKNKIKRKIEAWFLFFIFFKSVLPQTQPRKQPPQISVSEEIEPR